MNPIPDTKKRVTNYASVSRYGHGTHTLLSYAELSEIVELGIIENVRPEHINGTSIDITLGPLALKESNEIKHPCPCITWSRRETPNYYEIDVQKIGVTLEPGEFMLASSEQVFHLPDDLSCEYKLKSSMARCGLNHLNAGWCDPTWNGSVMTLELVNCLKRHAIWLNRGDPIGQVVFFRNYPVPKEKSYAERGRYNNDKRVHEIKI